MRLLLLSLGILFSSLLFSKETITIDIKSASLKDTLFAIAKTLKKEVIISNEINEQITIHAEKTAPEKLMNIIAKKYGLKYETINNLLIFTTQKEWEEQKKREHNTHLLKLATEPLYFYAFSLRYAKTNDVIALLTRTNHFSTKRGVLFSDNRTNTIIVHDTLEQINLLRKTLAHLDRPIKQLLLETYLVSIDHDNEKELGLTFKPNMNGFNINKWQFPQNLDVTLSMLEKKGQADILSSPRLFTANQETASIETGEEVPYQESSENGGTTVTFKKAVLGLKISPHILPAGRILLNLQMNHDRPSNRQVKDVPIITTRQITTNIILKNKETIVLGGIYERDNEQSHSGIIGLDKIPVFGGLFRKEIARQHKRELLIFVTPIIMNDRDERDDER